MLFAKDFFLKARYLLDLRAAKPVKRRTECNQPDRPNLTNMSSGAHLSNKAPASDKTGKSGRASNGGVAQLVRAAES